jgi:hypothetical protein
MDMIDNDELLDSITWFRVDPNTENLTMSVTRTQVSFNKPFVDLLPPAKRVMFGEGMDDKRIYIRVINEEVIGSRKLSATGGISFSSSGKFGNWFREHKIGSGKYVLEKVREDLYVVKRDERE